MERKVHKKRVLSWILSLVMVMTLGSPAYAVEIDDGTQPETNVSDELTSGVNTDEGADVDEDDSDTVDDETGEPAGDKTPANPGDPAVDQNEDEQTTEESGTEDEEPSVGEEPSNEEDEPIDPVVEEPQAEEVPEVVEEDASAVAKVGDQSYESLAAAIAAAAGKTVELQADVVLTESLFIRTDNVTIDLAGYTIQKDSENWASQFGSYMMRAYANLTIQDSEGTGSINSDSTIALYVPGSLTLKSGTIESTAIAILADSTGTVHIAGGTVEGAKALRAGESFTGTINISGGKVTGTDTAIYAEGGTINVSGSAEITGANFGAWMKNAALNVTGGSIVADNTDTIRINGGCEVNISGGEFNGSRSCIYGTDESGANTLSVTGGTFSYDGIGPIVAMSGTYNKNFITGGKFSKKVDWNCVGENYAQDEENLMFVIRAEIAKVLGADRYASLSAAVAAAENGQTVVMLNDTTEPITVEGKTITLDLNGKKLTGNVTNEGVLTIVDSVGGGVVTTESGNTYYTIENKGTLIVGTEGAANNFKLTTGATIKAGEGPSMIANHGKMTVYGGSFEGGLNNIKNEASAELTIYNGSFIHTGTSSSGATANILNYGIVVVENGTFLSTKSTSKSSAFNIYNSVASEGTAVKLTVRKGSFTAGNSTVYNYQGACDVQVYGGTHNKSVDANCWPDGYFAMKGEDGQYTIAQANIQLRLKYSTGSITTVGGYDTMEEAFAYAKTQGDLKTVRCVLRTDHFEDVVIPTQEELGGAEVEIYLNEHTLTNISSHTIYNQGNLTIRGVSGKEEACVVDNVSHGKAAVYNEVGATASLSYATFTRSKENGISKEDNGGNSYYVILNHGTMTFGQQNRVIQEGNYSSLVENGWQNGNQNATQAVSTLTISTNNTFSGGLNTIKNDDYGVLKINGGTYSNTSQAAVLNWNVATISGGTFNSDHEVIINAYGDDTMDQGKLTITKGTFNAGAGYPVINYFDGGTSLGTIEISGGNFNAGADAAAIIRENSAGSSIAVSGGTFNMEIPATQCADGFKPADDGNGSYSVAELSENEYLIDAYRQNSVQHTSSTGNQYHVFISHPEDKTITINGESETGIFAGWFSDNAFTQCLDAALTTGPAFARFAEKDLLTVKFQLSSGTTAESDKTSIRMFTTLDSKSFNGIGFAVKFKDETVTYYESNKTYNSIKIDGESHNAAWLNSDAQTAQYLAAAATLTVNKADFDKTITVTPYWITMDGTMVEGLARTTSVSKLLNTKPNENQGTVVSE